MLRVVKVVVLWVKVCLLDENLELIWDIWSVLEVQFECETDCCVKLEVGKENCEKVWKSDHSTEKCVLETVNC